MTVTEVAAKLGGRKIVVWLINIALATVLLWFGYITGDQWVKLDIYTTMALLAANAITHVGQAFGK